MERAPFGSNEIGVMRSKRRDSCVSREFPTHLIFKLFGSFGMAACRKWNRNLRNVGSSLTNRGYRAFNAEATRTQQKASFAF